MRHEVIRGIFLVISATPYKLKRPTERLEVKFLMEEGGSAEILI